MYSSQLTTKLLFYKCIQQQGTLVLLNNIKGSNLKHEPCNHMHQNMSSSTTTWSHKLA